MKFIVGAWGAEPSTWIHKNNRSCKVIGWVVIRNDDGTTCIEPVIWDDQMGPISLTMGDGWQIRAS